MEQNLKTAFLQPGRLFALVILAIVVSVFFIPLPEGFDPKLTKTAALVIAVMVLIVTNVLPEHMTFLGFMLAIVLTGIAPIQVAFGGFTSSVIWLVFGGTMISLAIQHTGFSSRFRLIAQSMASLSYNKILILVTFGAFASGLFMPSSISRIAILVPIALALAEQLGFREGRPGRHGIALAAGIGTYLPGAGILPANLPNVVFAGAVETAHGVQLTYGEFLLWHFPVTGFIKACLLVALLAYMYPDKRDEIDQTTEAIDPITGRQRILQLLLFATVALWATDFLHGIAPGYVSLLVALVIMLPILNLSPNDAFAGKMNLMPMFMLAGILAIGGVVQHSGIGGHIATNLIEFTNPQPNEPIRNFTILAGLASLLTAIATSPGAPVIMAPLAQDLAQAMGLPLFTVINMMVFGISIQILPYIGTPFIIAMSLSTAPMRDGVRLCLTMAALSIVVLGPLTFLWWKILGFI
jgi:anion transporter